MPDVPSPFATPLTSRSHLRWHPLRGEWVTYAAQRQGRPFLPPSDYNPLAPTTNPEFPTELPQGDYEIAVSSAALHYGDVGQFFITGFVAPERLFDEPDALVTWARVALAAAERVATKRGRAAPKRSRTA